MALLLNFCLMRGGNHQFGLLSEENIVRLSLVQLVNRELVDLLRRKPQQYGVLNNKLDNSDKQQNGTTCGLSIVDYVGNFGYIELQLPVFHIVYLKIIINILQMICKCINKPNYAKICNLLKYIISHFFCMYF
ncbi:hypothetical protein DICPUDRAFT_80079 [Dictyostelium purpureum]|uniref:DNA-directed RNA polymerase n=1 Tax=Dictyostelium purpureum TaxID=5786 RepID=F0ZPH0_DICPU|nr:uncharacterized protein DICPUDRAFT_80079 [Dictyostelium purpureum]EGC34156.1 hypothetical protein DICPUDRAFT_80079 [Dictyostelium purpureum]|eukprot:XP_003289310.1 hypothetical protein DICPUDRAFT_80079 [Dictyostelium purpureum]